MGGRPQKSGGPGPSHLGPGDHKCQPSAIGSVHLNIPGRGGFPGPGRSEHSHSSWVPQVPRIWAPGRAQILAIRFCPCSTSVVIRCTFSIDAARTRPIPTRRTRVHAGHSPHKFGPPEDSISNRIRTVNINTNKSFSFNALSHYPVQFQRIFQNCVQFSATLCLQMFNSQQPIRSHALSTKLRPQRNATL